MSIDSMIVAQLSGLAPVYPLVAPDTATLPYIVYQGVGGQAVNFYGGGQPSKENQRVQISVWAATLKQARAIAQQAETILRATATLNTTVETAVFTRHEQDTNRYGTYQFFSCWADIIS